MKYLKISILLSLLLLISCNNSTEEKKLALESNNSKTILSLGDSLTAGYSLDLEKSYPSQLEKILQKNNYNYKVINAGVSGDTSSQLLERIDLYLNDDEKIPEIAIIVIGGNDGLRGQSTKDLSKNIKQIINKLKEKNIKIVLAGMQIPPNLGLRYSNDFKNLYSKIADEEGVYLIDFFLEGVAGNANLNLNDGIHPNEKGYEIISKNIFEFLKSNKLIKND